MTTRPLPERVTPQPPDEDRLDRAADEFWAALVAATHDGAEHCDGEVAVLCSGGLESTLLAHALDGRGRATVLAYSRTWKDEAGRAQATATAAGLPLTAVTPKPFGGDQLAPYVALLDEPLGSTSGFAFATLATALPIGEGIVSGAGACLLSLINRNHRHLAASLATNESAEVTAQFARRVTFMTAAQRRRLLPADAAWSDRPEDDPVISMVTTELPAQGSVEAGLLAVVRRQLCAEAELPQLWSVFGARGQLPILPFFAPPVRDLMDTESLSLLRDDRFRRTLLERAAARHCPGYQPPSRQLGGGLPLGEPDYPDTRQLRDTIAAHDEAPLNADGLQELVAACAVNDGAARFSGLRRLWTALVLRLWLQQTTKSDR